MRSAVREHEGCFAIELVAESLAEAAVLVRLGMNSTALRVKATHVYSNAEFSLSVVFGKHRRADSDVPPRSRR